MFGTYIGNKKMIINLAYGGMLTISSDDLSLMPSLVTKGLIETPLTKYFIDNVKVGDTVVDVGTNVGYFTILAAKLVGSEGTVIGFEANPEIYNVLKDNIAMNWITKQTKLINKAVYSETSRLQFRASKKFHGDSSLQVRPTDENVVDEYSLINIDAVTLDDELMKTEQIDLLKIDIEGGEYQAFLGMVDTIRKGKINKIVFEWNKIMLGKESSLFASLIEELLNNYNGNLYSLDSEGTAIPVALESITSIDFYPYALIVFK